MTINERIVEATIHALKLVRNVRYFRTERGYQGEFFCGLNNALFEMGILGGDLILEMEYQKVQDRHSMTQRPDIILHVPTEISQVSARENNIAVWALKRQANINDSQSDFDKIDEMFGNLAYDLGFFINIDSDNLHLDHYRGRYPTRLNSFAVQLSENILYIKQASFSKGRIHERVIYPSKQSNA